MSIESWRDGYQRGFLDGVDMRKRWDEEQDFKLIKSRLDELVEMRNEWDEDYYDYYRAGMVTRPFEKSFDEVAFPDKCQECNGDCKVC